MVIVSRGHHARRQWNGAGSVLVPPGVCTGMSTATSTRARRWVLALVAIASFIVSLDALVVSTALPTIRAQLHTSLAALEWTVDAYVLTFAVLMMTAAALADRFGRPRILAAGLALFAAASVVCALAPNAALLIAGRALQGAGAACVMPVALAILGAAFPPRERGRAMGAFAAMAGLAVLCGPLLGGIVVQGLSWEWIFWLNVPIAVAMVPLVLTRIPESRRAAAPLDVPGVAALTATAFAIVWGLVRAGEVGWQSVEIWVALGAGVVLAGVVVLVEQRSRTPMLPLHLFRVPAFTAGNLAIFFFWATGLGSLFFMAQYFQVGLGYGPLDSGLRLMPWGATTVVMPLVAGALINRVGERALTVTGLVLHAASLFWIAAIAQQQAPYWQLAVALLLSGVGCSIATPAIQSAIIGAVEPAHTGTASGVLSTMRQLGGVFGVAVLAAVFAGRGSYVSPSAFTAGFVVAMVACGVLALLGALAGRGLRRAMA
jgi:EmrB/QacA subfamily drug resistance transporter